MNVFWRKKEVPPIVSDVLRSFNHGQLRGRNNGLVDLSITLYSSSFWYKEDEVEIVYEDPTDTTT